MSGPARHVVTSLMVARDSSTGHSPHEVANRIALTDAGLVKSAEGLPGGATGGWYLQMVWS